MAAKSKKAVGVKKAAPAQPAMQRQRAASGGFDAASIGRRTEKWYTTPSGINSLLQFTLPLMRDRVRDQARNVSWVKRSVRSWVANVIGTGIRPIPVTPDAEFNKIISELWSDWIEVCDAEGRLDFYGQQSLAARAFKTAGEVLIRKLYRSTDKYDLPVPLQLQMIEADQLDHRLSEKLPDGGKILQGVELDAEGARRFYHLWKEHPAEMLSGWGGSVRVKVPEKEIIHIFEPDRPGQQRGYPSMVSSVIRMLDLMEYEDATLVRQKLGAMLVGFITSMASEDGGGVLGEQGVGSSDVPEATLESGTMQKLDPGQDVKFNTPVDVGQNFEMFLQWQLRAQAADADVTYEQASGDLRNVSFSSIRAGLNEVQRIHEQTQDNIFIHQFCRNVWSEFVTTAVMAGSAPMPKDFVAQKRKYLRAKWIPDGWPYVSPLDEARATEIDLRNGVASRSAQVARRGRDINDLDKEIAADNARADELGLIFDSDPRHTDVRGDVRPPAGASDEGAPADTGEPKTDPKKAAKKGKAKS
jgi:lambda family phage portal protein